MPEMPEITEAPEKPRLHVGLVSLNRKHLLSPPGEVPELLLSPQPLTPGQNIEHAARTFIQSQGIIVSALCALTVPRETFDRGYALRTVRPIEAEQYGLKPYAKSEIIDYLDAHPADDIRQNFLRQIVRYMNI